VIADTLPGRTKALVWLPAGVALFAASVLVYRQIIVSHPGLWVHSDEWVYRSVGVLVRRHPADLYSARMGASRLPFTYPPFAALVFAAASPFSFGAWQIALVVIDLILLPVISYAALRISGHNGIGGAVLAFVLAAIALWLEPVYMTMLFGQINLILLALIMVDLALPDSSSWKGIGIGIAAGLKLTPLIFVPYLLASRRVRAAVVSLLSFAATAVLGFVALPAASRGYWEGNLAPHGGLERLQNQSVRAVVQRLTHGGLAAGELWVALVAVVAAAGLATAVWASRRGLELLGIVLCGVTGLLASPVSWTHHWVWVIPGLALLAGGAGRGGAGGGPRNRIARAGGAVVIVALFAMWPAPTRLLGVTTWLPKGFLRFAPHNHGREYAWHGAMLLLGNAFVIAGLAAIIGAGGYLWATRNRAPHEPASRGSGNRLTAVASGPGRPGDIPERSAGP
jgi:Glycosyltransferase family 87